MSAATASSDPPGAVIDQRRHGPHPGDDAAGEPAARGERCLRAGGRAVVVALGFVQRRRTAFASHAAMAANKVRERTRQALGESGSRRPDGTRSLRMYVRRAQRGVVVVHLGASLWTGHAD
jgi:hypothetical protein